MLIAYVLVSGRIFDCIFGYNVAIGYRVTAIGCRWHQTPDGDTLMMDLQRTMGAVIRRERRERQLTLKDLAERSAISLVYLGEIERGKKYPSALVLERLAKSLDLGVPDLLEYVAEEMRGVALPQMAIGFFRSDVQPVPSRTTPTGSIMSILVA
jgi:transcriptional regulator with XRE-family HTH domain